MAKFEKTFGNEGGGGRTRVIENGNVIEKAVSFRHGNYEAMQKMFNVGEADFLPAD
jgi:coproporphyrinogen III oxidase